MVWTLPVTTPDTYDVYARSGTNNSGASNAKYTVTHAGGTDTVTLDQTAYDGSWIKLGTYDLAPDAGHNVTLSDRANGQVAADAIRIVSTSGGERVARWQGSVAGAGTYQVWARWTAAPTHSFAATYRVTTPGGTNSVTVDQRSGGGRWHLLKTLTLAANDNWQVELSDQSPGEVVADAIAVTPPISLADRFEWAPTLPAAGDYAVYAKWQSDATRATDATYEITHDGGVAQVTVDQTHNGGDWRYLGSWSFDPLNAPKVTLLGSLTGTLSADAIRFVAGDAIGGDIAYTHADQLGTIQKMTDATGSLAWDRTQRPFGETIAISAVSGIANPLRFPGQYADETGLSYNYFRDYDPTIGRYLQSDPIGLGGGINTYAYVGGNPISRMDPTGEYWQLVAITAFQISTCTWIHIQAQHYNDPCADTDWGAAVEWSLNCVTLTRWMPHWAWRAIAAGRAGGRLGWGLGNGKKGGDLSPTTGSGGGNKGGQSGGSNKPKPERKKVKPAKDADGEHTTWKTDGQGNMTRHETWRPNPKNPNGFDSVQSTDIFGKPHRGVDTPHTQGPGIPGGVRPARPDELPSRRGGWW